MSAMMWYAAAGVLQAGAKSYQARVDTTNQISYYNHIIQNAMDNQVLTDLEMMKAKRAGRVKENANRLKFKHMVAGQKAVTAGRNIRMTGGSPVDIMLSTKVIEAKDRENIAENTDNEVFGLKVKKFNYKSQEDIARNKLATLNANTAGSSAFFGSLLSSAGSFALAKYAPLKSS